MQDLQQSQEEVTDFLKLMREKRAIVELDNKLASRSVNEGFSGGEKKRNEIFQMAMLEPKLAILYETDSGLDIDALRIVANGVNQLRTPENAAIVTPAHDNAHTLLRVEAQPPRGRRKHNRLQNGLFVFQRKVHMTRSVEFQVRDFSSHGNVSQYGICLQDPFDVAVELRYCNRF